MCKMDLKIENKYIKIPVNREKKEQKVSFFRSGKKVMEFNIPLCESEEKAEFFGFLPVERWVGENLEIHWEEGKISDWKQVEECEKKNPDYAVHFAPASGWMNDPNGLCFYKGEYHLFFQHNIFHTIWDNISWGHAVSKDLIHWEQVKEAILPDEEGMAYSGSALENVHGLLGCPEGAILLFYSRAGEGKDWKKGKHFTQKVVWSEDGRKFSDIKEPVIPYMVDENRDPKVYWMDETREYYMVLFMENHDYDILVSKDLKTWEKTQTITIPESWECPDLVKLSTENGEAKWVFWTPDGYYLVGEFDGRKFVSEQKIEKIYGNKLPYAAQTFSGVKERVIQLPWMRMENKGKRYKGVMGVPREMRLVKRGERYLLSEPVVREVKEKAHILAEKVICDGWEISWEKEGAVWLEMQENQESFRIEIGKMEISWDRETKEFAVTGKESVRVEQIEDINLLLDGNLMEIGCNQDTVCLFYEVDELKEKQIEITGSGKIVLNLVE